MGVVELGMGSAGGSGEMSASWSGANLAVLLFSQCHMQNTAVIDFVGLGRIICGVSRHFQRTGGEIGRLCGGNRGNPAVVYFAAQSLARNLIGNFRDRRLCR